MFILRKASGRGQSTLDWLKSYHTFSFAEYDDKQWMGFEMLRVINEDYIQPGRGFGMHPHKDMEILTYVVSGSLKHEDSMGHGSVIVPGEIQRMSAGTGVFHSEFNHSHTELLHLLQIWILPSQKNISPGYEQKTIPETINRLNLIASNNPSVDAVTIHQNMDLYVGHFEKNTSFEHVLDQNPSWIQLIKGHIQVNQQALHASDGLGLWDEKTLSIQCIEASEFLIFHMFPKRKQLLVH